MQLVWRERPEVRLLVAGSGPAAEAVPDDPRVELIEHYVPEAQLDDLLAQASLVALPYLEGSQSYVGLLAVARGIPVVASRVGSLPDLTLPGLVVTAGDATELAATLLRGLDHDGALRRQTLEHARQFSWDAVAKRSLALYRDVLAT
jgi:glycosyltransferase involved in cell wall biosynthesis